MRRSLRERLPFFMCQTIYEGSVEGQTFDVRSFERIEIRIGVKVVLVTM